MVKISKYLIIILILMGSNSIAQNVNAVAGTDSSNYRVGDYINLYINVEHEDGMRIYTPMLKDTANKIEFISGPETKTEYKDGKKISKVKYVISRYDSGDVYIDPIPIEYTYGSDTTKKIVYTNEIAFIVHTLDVDPQKGITDIKAPVKISLDWKTILLISLLITILIAAILYFLYRYKKNKKPKAKPQIIIKKKPHQIALDELAQLEQKRLYQKGMIKEYHSEITEIIRRYFEDRFFIPALEIPTSELLEKLRSTKAAGPVYDLTKDFLNNADMVKFAKYIPLNNINEQMMIQAVKIVNLTKPEIELEMHTEVRNVE